MLRAFAFLLALAILWPGAALAQCASPRPGQSIGSGTSGGALKIIGGLPAVCSGTSFVSFSTIASTTSCAGMPAGTWESFGDGFRYVCDGSVWQNPATGSSGGACSASGAQDFFAGRYHTCDGNNWVRWCRADEQQPPIVSLLSTGTNTRGELGLGTGPSKTAFVSVPSPTGVTWSEIAAGSSHACGIDSTGAAYCWGRGSEGALGIGSLTDQSYAVKLTSPTGAVWTNMNMGPGARHSCGIDQDQKLYCWGNGNSGQVGNGGAAFQPYPLRVTSPTNVSWTNVSAGGFHTCGIDSAGKLYCWGSNTSVQLGNNSTTQQTRAISVVSPTGVSWSSVSSGQDHTCATDTDARLWCWGSGSNGALGTGNTSLQGFPKQVVSPTTVSWTTVKAGTSSTCGITITGNLYCWGANTNGQLGIGNTSQQNSAVKVVSPTGVSWTEVRLGALHTCGTDSTGAAYCWGRGFEGQLGISSTAQQTRPVLVTSPTGVSVTGIACGNGFTSIIAAMTGPGC